MATTQNYTHTAADAYASLKRARDERALVATHYANLDIHSIDTRQNPALALLASQTSLSQHFVPQQSIYFRRDADIVPMWVAVVELLPDEIFFYYASEMTRNRDTGVWETKPQKAGGARKPHNITVGTKRGNCTEEAFSWIRLVHSVSSPHLRPYFFEIFSSTPRNGLHEWLDAFWVYGDGAVEHSMREYREGSQSRNT